MFLQIVKKMTTFQHAGAALANSGGMQTEPTAADDSNRPEQDPPANDAPRILQAEELFAGRREVWIQHGDQRYRLRITAAGKLILTK